MSDVREEVGSRRSRRFLARTGTAAIGAAALVAAVAIAPAATAAKPNQQACLGKDIPAYAQAGAGFGSFVSVLADGGAGDEIQGHLAGQVPDTTINNSCND